MCQSWLFLSLLLCGAVVATAAAAAPLDPSTSPSDAASLVSPPYPPLTQMATSEFTVDRNGLWTDIEVPLSDASMRAIRESTLASPQDESDVASTVVHTAAAADEMETSAAVDENENENEAADVAEDGIDSDIERETSIAPTSDDVESAESETSATSDEIDIATGRHGRMILIPRSSRLEMAPLVNRLTRIISELKQHSSSLDRITLKLEIEPMLPRKTRHVIPRVRRLSPPRLSRPRSRPRARPISIRLVPSRSEIRSRKMLARCRMLLRQAMKKLKRMKLQRTRHQPRLAPRRHRKPRMTRLARWLRRLGVGRTGGVTVLHGNRFKKIDRSTRRISRGNYEVEAEHNSTARLFAPSIALRMNGGSMLVVNRGVIVIVNRSANNTLSVAPPAPAPAPHHRGMFRHFMTPPSHLELAAAVNAAPAPALVIEPALNAAEGTTTTSTPNEN